MPGARDTELLNYIRSYGQTPPSPPQCQFNHWGLTVYLPPELAKQFEPPADYVAFAEFMEQMLPHCRVFMSAYPGTRDEDPQKVLQAFIDHFMTPSPDNPIPNFRRYGHKGHGQPYPIWFLKCFCNFLKEHYPVAGKATEVPLLPPRDAVNPLARPHHCLHRHRRGKRSCPSCLTGHTPGQNDHGRNDPSQRPQIPSSRPGKGESPSPAGQR